MLVLTRKTNERLIIGDGIEVVVVSVKGNAVRLGISAPPWVRVLREELLDPALEPQAVQTAGTCCYDGP